jgi:hypothetical protein
MKLSIGIIIHALVMASCAPPRVVTQLTPEAPEGHIEMGREYITLNSDSIIVELGYDGTHGDYLVFDFVVINKTTHPLQINPSDFYFELLDSATADTTKFPPRMAIHPERIIQRYDKTLEAKEDEKAINTLFGFIEAGVDLLAHTSAFIATEDPGYMMDAVFSTLGTADHYIRRERQIGNEIHRISDEKEVVREEIFRVSQLPPGKVLSGYVYFPKEPGAGCLMFCFPVEDLLFQFVYNQQQVIHYL